MRLRGFLWFALLFPQYALLSFALYDNMRELRHEMQFYYPRPMMSCLGYPPFDALQFGWEVLGLAGVIGLCGKCWWARYCYAIFAVGVFVTLMPDLLHPHPNDTVTLLIAVVVFAVALATLTLCFIRRLRFL